MNPMLLPNFLVSAYPTDDLNSDACYRTPAASLYEVIGPGPIFALSPALHNT